jgi:hypothetical protein
MPKEEKKAGEEAIPDLRFLGIKIKTPNKTPKINATTAITISQVQPLRLLKKKEKKRKEKTNIQLQCRVPFISNKLNSNIKVNNKKKEAFICHSQCKD